MAPSVQRQAVGGQAASGHFALQDAAGMNGIHVCSKALAAKLVIVDDLGAPGVAVGETQV